MCAPPPRRCLPRLAARLGRPASRRPASRRVPAAWQDANIIFGTSVDETFNDEISVTVVATSFDMPQQVGGQQPIQIAAPRPQGGAQQWPPQAPDPYAPPAPETRKPRFWGRF